LLLTTHIHAIVRLSKSYNLGCWGHRSEKVKLRGLDNVACKMFQCAVLLKNKIIIRNVFGGY